ncbi:MAG: hypothetical protein M3Q07_28530 [Pseudobdellovibrionaceae bacterium]|nr:hypothetical protein [Pseudobdellovibrionaceae bacterium]
MIGRKIPAAFGICPTPRTVDYFSIRFFLLWKARQGIQNTLPFVCLLLPSQNSSTAIAVAVEPLLYPSPSKLVTPFTLHRPLFDIEEALFSFEEDACHSVRVMAQVINQMT